jgi:hypothetical protein
MLQDAPLIVLTGLRSLRIASRDGAAPGNEYRIHERSVECRALDANGKPYPHANGKWHTLDKNEIQLHFALKTPVADWLDKNLYSSQAA